MNGLDQNPSAQMRKKGFEMSSVTLLLSPAGQGKIKFSKATWCLSLVGQILTQKVCLYTQPAVRSWFLNLKKHEKSEKVTFRLKF